MKHYYESFDLAFAAWAANYIVSNGFQAFQRLPRSKKNLSLKMIKDGFLYAK